MGEGSGLRPVRGGILGCLASGLRQPQIDLEAQERLRKKVTVPLTGGILQFDVGLGAGSIRSLGFRAAMFEAAVRDRVDGLELSGVEGTMEATVMGLYRA